VYVDFSRGILPWGEDCEGLCEEFQATVKISSSIDVSKKGRGGVKLERNIFALVKIIHRCISRRMKEVLIF
jgi:hypothetical protein